MTGLEVIVGVGHNSPRAENIRNFRPVETSRILDKRRVINRKTYNFPKGTPSVSGALKSFQEIRCNKQQFSGRIVGSQQTNKQTKGKPGAGPCTDQFCVAWSIPSRPRTERIAGLKQQILQLKRGLNLTPTAFPSWMRALRSDTNDLW